MNQPDTLYLILSVAVIVITGLLVYVGNELVKTLRLAQKNLELTEVTLNDIVLAKNNLKRGILGLVTMLLNVQNNKLGGDSHNEQGK